MPGTWKYVALHCKSDFADVSKSRILGRESILDNLGEPDVITRVLIGGKQEGQSQRKRCNVGREGQREI